MAKRVLTHDLSEPLDGATAATIDDSAGYRPRIASSTAAGVNAAPPASSTGRARERLAANVVDFARMSVPALQAGAAGVA